MTAIVSPVNYLSVIKSLRAQQAGFGLSLSLSLSLCACVREGERKNVLLIKSQLVSLCRRLMGVHDLFLVINVPGCLWVGVVKRNVGRGFSFTSGNPPPTNNLPFSVFFRLRCLLSYTRFKFVLLSHLRNYSRGVLNTHHNHINKHYKLHCKII